MNKLSKIFLAIIIILVIALGISIHACITYKDAAETNKNYFLDTVKEFTRYRAEQENSIFVEE